MLDSDAWFDVSDLLEAEDFYFPEHRQIFEAMLEQDRESKPIDTLTLADVLIAHGKLESAGGVDYLGDLAANARGTANLRHYAEIVHDRAVLRKLISAGNKIIDNCYNTEGAAVADILDQAEQRIFALPMPSQGQGARGANPCSAKPWIESKSLKESGTDLTGMSSVFIDLDKITPAGRNPSQSCRGTAVHGQDSVRDERGGTRDSASGIARTVLQPGNAGEVWFFACCLSVVASIIEHPCRQTGLPKNSRN